MSLSKKLKSTKKQIADLHKGMVETGKAVLQDAFVEFFQKHGDQVKSLRWRQYTPHFNDGDACTFSVNELAAFDTVDPDESEHDEWCGMESGDTRWNPETRKNESVTPPTWGSDFEELDSFIQGNEEVLLALYGDHAQITVTASGVDVDSYDHD